MLILFELVGDFWKAANSESIYISDTFPIAVGDNMRISRSRHYHGEAFHGYQASKRRYFYGVKVHLMVTATGQPVEFFLTPGYCTMEDILKDTDLHLIPIRKRNSERPLPPWMCFLRSHYHQAI